MKTKYVPTVVENISPNPTINAVDYNSLIDA